MESKWTDEGITPSGQVKAEGFSNLGYRENYSIRMRDKNVPPIALGLRFLPVHPGPEQGRRTQEGRPSCSRQRKRFTRLQRVIRLELGLLMIDTGQAYQYH